jgi:two-component system chemotaxis sensor kinase CheA
VTSPIDFDTIKNELSRIDPDGKFLSVSKCTSRPEARTGIASDGRYINNLMRSSHQESGTAYGGSIPVAALAEMTEMMGGLVADQSTLNRVISRLSELDTTETMMRLLRSTLSGTNLGPDAWEKVRRDLETYWAPWEIDISTMAQTEMKLSAALVQLQEKTRSLGLRPASELLDSLPKFTQTIAFRQGKQVSVESHGKDTDLDQRTLKTLAESVQGILAYCINESIELPDQRSQSGKNTIGKLSVSAMRTENHTQVTIEDDGSGLDFKKILARGAELGWNGKHITDDDLTGWLFKPEYYAQTNMSINQAILRSILEAEKGKITLINKPGLGLKFIITLQVDMAVVDGMVVRINDIRYIVPVHAIQRILQPTEENLIENSAGGGGSLLNMEGKIYPVRSFKSGSMKESIRDGQHPRLLVIIEKEPQSVALEVDELIGRQSVLVRPLAGTLGNSRNTIGCALLGEGEVGMVLDLEAL